MSATVRKKREARNKQLQQRRRRILKRLNNSPEPERAVPMMTASNIHYELSDRVQGLSAGGIGAMLLLARRTGLIGDIDDNLHLLKVHLPYHESDHVLNIAFNVLAGGQRLEHLELRRNDEVYLNALGAERIPDPTTAGDFCRRFCGVDVMTLMDAINKTRQRVWAEQPPEFFEEAILDADGTIVPSDAECKQGMDFAYDGQYGYHPLLISLANTAEPLFLFNRRERPGRTRKDQEGGKTRRPGRTRAKTRKDMRKTRRTSKDQEGHEQRPGRTRTAEGKGKTRKDTHCGRPGRTRTRKDQEGKTRKDTHCEEGLTRRRGRKGDEEGHERRRGRTKGDEEGNALRGGANRRGRKTRKKTRKEKKTRKDTHCEEGLTSGERPGRHDRGGRRGVVNWQ